jgi:drug/metabolite transporter (DMT)-like permease
VGAIVFALLAALCNAVSVLTRHVASTADPDRPTGLRLVGYLLTNPRWLAGSGAQVGAFAFQALALQFGQVSVVQPLLVTELVMALVLRRVFIHQAVARAAWAGAAAACAGLAVFIVAAEPRGGHDGPTSSHWTAAIVASLAVVGALITLARGGSPARRAAMYGAAGGITWALEATFIKSATNDLAQSGLSGLFTNWPVYAVAVGGAAGVIIEQAALQSGPLRVSQPLLTITDPIVSIALSVWLFGEYFVLNPAVLAAAAAGFLVMCGGVVLLSLTAPATVEEDAAPPGDAGTVRDELLWFPSRSTAC